MNKVMYKEKLEELFKEKKIITIAIALIFFAIILALALGRNGNQSKSDENIAKTAEKENAFTFNYNADSSKAFIKIGDSKEEFSEYVTGYSNGKLYISPEGLCKAFNLTKEEVTDEEKEAYYEAAEHEDIFIEKEGEFIKLKDDKTFLFLENSSLYLVDGRTSIMNGSVIRKDGILSMPLNYIVFDLGFNGFGVGTEGNSVIFALEK